jgi:predicted phage terminase large subunit-like protein
VARLAKRTAARGLDDRYCSTVTIKFAETAQDVVHASSLASISIWATTAAARASAAGWWNRAFIDELCAFPNGAHDDQVDAASAAFRSLLRRVTSS